MPDLTPAEQAIVRELERNGPTTRAVLLGRLARSGPLAAARPGDYGGYLDSLLSRGLLLERERTVTCERCQGKGRRGPLWDHEYCSPCKGTGSVKERVIGVACRDCKGSGEDRSRSAPPPAIWRPPCSRCSSTPTPGLDPGDR